MSKEPPLPVKSLPSPIRHSHILKDEAQKSDGCATGGRRILSYYTFATGIEESELRKHHPVLYLHGFPGSGVEAALYANAAVKSQCQLFGIDRPGFGYSSPSPSADWNNPDAYVQSFVSDIWDFVRAMGWKSFSIIGVSGGGPYSLAILDSYLKSKLGDRCSAGHAIQCNLEAVSIVAGVFGTAGSQGMMPSNQKLMAISSLRGWKSSLAHFGLLLLVSIQRLILLNILLRIFSEKRLLKMATSSAMKDLPDCDKQVFLDDEAVGLTFLGDAKEALRQSAAPAVLEAKVLFREGYYFEQSLRKNWTAINETKLPRATLFQGHLDVNVPPAHSQFVHENIFGGKGASLAEFDDMGHLSLVIKKADEVMKSVARR